MLKLRNLVHRHFRMFLMVEMLLSAKQINWRLGAKIRDIYYPDDIPLFSLLFCLYLSSIIWVIGNRESLMRAKCSSPCLSLRLSFGTEFNWCCFYIFCMFECKMAFESLPLSRIYRCKSWYAKAIFTFSQIFSGTEQLLFFPLLLVQLLCTLSL